MRNDYAAIATRLYPGAELQAVERFTGGVSADVHRLDLKLADGGSISLVLRALGSAHSGHSAEPEYQLLCALYQGGLPVPEPLTVDASGELLADLYLLMKFADGSSTLQGNDESRYFQAMAGELQKIHALPTVGLPPLPAQQFMGDWGLDPELESHMRTEALAGIREAAAVLMGSASA